MKTDDHRAWIILPLTAAATTAVLVAAFDTQAQDAQTNVSKKGPPQGRAVSWTMERTLTATAKPIPQVDPAKIKRGAGPVSGDAAQRGSTDARDEGRGSPRISGDPGTKPLYWAGKLFYRQPDGDYTCSAQFVTNRVILTAAHCLRDMNTGEWYDDFEFYLQYNRGNYSRRYSYECVTTKQGWVIDNGDQWKFDFGFILARGTSQTGYFGYHYGYGNEYERAPKIGYPVDILNGQVIQIDGGSLFIPPGENGIVGLRHGNPRNAGGSSGGAWVAGFGRAPNNKNFIISVTSHSRGNDTIVSYGPMFDFNFKDLLDYASRGCR